MKKWLIPLMAAACLGWLGVLGCSNNNIDTAKVRQALQSLPDNAKEFLEQGLKDIDQSNFVAAVRPLKKVVFTVKLDKTQRAVLEDTIAKAQARAAKQKK
jgi:hypothetical protein